MKASSIVLVAALIVLLGRWSQGKKIEATIVVGGLFSALIISMIDGSQPKIAKGFAYIFLAVATLTYIGEILNNTLGKPK